MAKTYSELITVDVPPDILYDHFKQKYQGFIDSSKGYSTLEKNQYKLIDSGKDRKLTFTEDYLFIKAKNELKFEPMDDGGTKVLVKIEIPWSPWREKMGQSSLLGFKTDLRSIEKLYDSMKKRLDVGIDEGTEK